MSKRKNILSKKVRDCIRSNEIYAKNTPGSVKVVVVAPTQPIVDGIAHGLDRWYDEIVVAVGIVSDVIDTQILEICKKFSASLVYTSEVDRTVLVQQGEVSSFRMNFPMETVTEYAQEIMNSPEGKEALMTFDDAISFVLEITIKEDRNMVQPLQVLPTKGHPVPLKSLLDGLM